MTSSIPTRGRGQFPEPRTDTYLRWLELSDALASSSPDLYDALKDCVERIGDLHGEVPGSARSALKKVEKLSNPDWRWRKTPAGRRALSEGGATE